MPTAIIGADSSTYFVDHDWHRDLAACLADRYIIHTQALAESTTILSNGAHKRALRLRSSAIAADMESAALAALARKAGVPFLVIRAVSDRADARVPHWLTGCLGETGRLAVGKTLGLILTRPSDWGAIFGLALGFRAARATLAGVSERIGPRQPPIVGATKTATGAKIAGQHGAARARE
jgi:hypothetical protein